MRYHIHSCLLSRECWKIEILGGLSFIILMVRDKKRERDLIYWIKEGRYMKQLLDGDWGAVEADPTQQLK